MLMGPGVGPLSIMPTKHAEASEHAIAALVLQDVTNRQKRESIAHIVFG